MTTEQLLAPRYKVIADYPGCPFNVGNILYHDIEQEERYWYSMTANDNRIYVTDINLYPHLFKKLEWWEERKQNDFPEYVKPLEPTDGFIKQFGDVILKVRLNTIGIWDNGRASFFAENLFQAARLDFADYLPATELEYSQYQASKPKQP